MAKPTINYTKVNEIVDTFFSLSPSIDPDSIEDITKEFLKDIMMEFESGDLGEQLYTMTNVKDMLDKKIEENPDKFNDFFTRNTDIVDKYKLFTDSFTKLNKDEQLKVLEKITKKIYLNMICHRLSQILKHTAEQSEQQPAIVPSEDGEEVSQSYVPDKEFKDPACL